MENTVCHIEYVITKGNGQAVGKVTVESDTMEKVLEQIGKYTEWEREKNLKAAAAQSIVIPKGGTNLERN